MKNLICCILLLNLLILYPKVLDRIAAVVGNEIILQSELDQFVMHQKYMSSQDIDQEEINKKVLDELIASKVLYETALRDTTISVSEEEVQRMLDSRINSVLEQVGSEAKFEELYNTTISDLKKQYRSDIRKNLFIEKLRNKKLRKIDVNRKEVRSYYYQNKDSLPSVEATLTLAQLVVGFSDKSLNEKKIIEDLHSLRQEIISGDISFEKAAKKYSQDPSTAKNGGKIGTTTRGDLVPEFEKSAYNLSLNEISDPVRTAFGFHLIKLNKKTGEKINTSHILLIPDQNVKNDSVALNHAKNIKDSVLNKFMTFEEAVKKYSKDEKTKFIGGNIGTLKINELEDEYKDIFKNKKVGFISEPLKEKDGYYIYKINDRTKPHDISLETDYQYLKELARADKREILMKKWIEHLKKKVYIEIK